MLRRSLPVLQIALMVSLTGCATNRTSDTARTGMEQILISNAVDLTLSKLELPPVAGRKVFLDPQYLDSVDKGYIVSSLRQRLLTEGATLVDKKEGSELTLEVCSGGVGTDNSTVFWGVPGMAVPGPMPLQIPELRFYEKGSQYGTAKISLYTYATDTGQLITDSGCAVARSDDSRWSILGLGSFHSGTAHREINSAYARQPEAQRTAEVADPSKQIR